ncbi:SET domain-containing protein, partial [Xylona heveae TC161]
PKNWPAGIIYLTEPAYSSQLGPSELSALRQNDGPVNGPGIINTLPSPLVKITAITSPATHPAVGQYGLFAARDLAPSSFIVDYLGYVHPASDTDESSNYDLCLDADCGVGVDATKMGNEARFTNDYRGIRPEGPNAEFKEHVVNGERRMSIWVLPAGKNGHRKRGIRKGEEICVSYGKGFWRER